MKFVYVVFEVEGNPNDRTTELYPLIAFDSSAKCMDYIKTMKTDNPDKQYDFEQVRYIEDKEQK